MLKLYELDKLFLKRIIHILKANGDSPNDLLSIPHYHNVKRIEISNQLATRKFNDIFRMYSKLNKLGMQMAPLSKVAEFLKCDLFFVQKREAQEVIEKQLIYSLVLNPVEWNDNLVEIIEGAGPDLTNDPLGMLCRICMTKLENDERCALVARKSHCTHTFHCECLEGFITCVQHQCPICFDMHKAAKIMVKEHIN